MAGLNISLSLVGLNRRQTCSSEKITTWAYISFWFPPSAVVLPALYSSLHRQQNKRNYTTPISEMFFTFFMRKTLREKPSSLNVCEVALQAASAYKRREFWREIHTSFASDWTYNFFSFLFFFLFTCQNHLSFLLMKIYDIALWWVFLNMYVLSCYLGLYM